MLVRPQMPFLGETSDPFPLLTESIIFIINLFKVLLMTWEDMGLQADASGSHPSAFKNVIFSYLFTQAAQTLLEQFNTRETFHLFIFKKWFGLFEKRPLRKGKQRRILRELSKYYSQRCFFPCFLTPPQKSLFPECAATWLSPTLTCVFQLASIKMSTVNTEWPFLPSLWQLVPFL